jgi:Domain of Unknown Function with PDB structure (DUF3857)/Transglutaminase-like superfamily
MKDRLSYSRHRPRRAIDLLPWLIVAGFVFGWTTRARADAPSWMHALVRASLPEHNEKAEAIVLYSETSITVLSVDKIRRQVRVAFKILRPEGRNRGTVWVYLNSHRKIKSLHGWCIPAQGKDSEVKDKDSLETSPPLIEGAELIEDVKFRVLHIPAPDPGNIVGYEYEVEEEPFFLQDTWAFQTADPVRESRYSLQLPSGWEYRSTWLNHGEVAPTQTGNQWQWAVSDVKWLRHEPDMPPFSGVEGQMIVSFFPPGGAALNGFADWNAMGRWYANLVAGRADASPEIKQGVASLTASKATSLQKMQALAEFLQRQVRYVAIELGIGGWQPHPAPQVFSNRYGDCKDKATLLRSMLHEIGVDSYPVVIYTERGAVTPRTPARGYGFNHVILAIRLPDDVSDSTLVATLSHPKLGRILFFDPTDTVTPFGQIRGPLQANYGLLVAHDGGELVELPQEPSQMNSIQRVAILSLDSGGTLKGEVKETRVGDRASSERYRLLTVSKDTDRIKPLETLLSNSLANFQITHASVSNLQQTDRQFGWDYTFETHNYAKNAGDLLLVRPRVLGNKGLTILETKEPREFPVEFPGPAHDTDTFDITIPDGYVVDDVPPPVDADYSFASYHAKTVVQGNVIHYSRTFEVKELSVPVSRVDDLKKFYRIIAGDERNTAVLKAAAK